MSDATPSGLRFGPMLDDVATVNFTVSGPGRSTTANTALSRPLLYIFFGRAYQYFFLVLY